MSSTAPRSLIYLSPPSITPCTTSAPPRNAQITLLRDKRKHGRLRTSYLATRPETRSPQR
ncbi:uncharacterized protein SCHCODRAFT_02637642 [Schizophyllum commune H4-8]|uniref:uncharacterized protein n=1 Tax=Schizophyllum commune (strain H4-8 / FGSC 9210) TaxID=578458 RepID=UPI00215FBEB4|nr:uncharacterized protein SCHCODRAFT_02637642 [Schizophyllum commune H4-8]KAI5888766.1 hypothetical protein SCHCODRAFT_02637642 [Schizophyllum commune H4-8]